jgi:hypothetical protein
VAVRTVHPAVPGAAASASLWYRAYDVKLPERSALFGSALSAFSNARIGVLQVAAWT